MVSIRCMRGVAASALVVTAQAQTPGDGEPQGDCDLSFPHTPLPPPLDRDGLAQCYSMADGWGDEYGPGTPNQALPGAMMGNFMAEAASFGNGHSDQYLINVNLQNDGMGWENFSGEVSYMYYVNNATVGTGETYFRRVDDCASFPQHYNGGDPTKDLSGPDPVDDSRSPQCYFFRDCYHTKWIEGDRTNNRHHSNEISLSPQKDGTLYWAYVSCYEDRVGVDDGPGRITADGFLSVCPRGSRTACVDGCRDDAEPAFSQCKQHCRDNC